VDASGKSRRLFRKCGFYLHAGWTYEYPFAVRRWTRRDYAGMFRLLRRLNLDQVMIWPMMELAPPPLSETDAAYYREFRLVVDDARAAGLECLLTSSPNLSTTEVIRAEPNIRERVWFPHERVFQFNQPGELDAYLRHAGALLQCLNNADGFVFIDGDPGGYPGARPAEFWRCSTAFAANWNAPRRSAGRKSCIGLGAAGARTGKKTASGNPT